MKKHLITSIVGLALAACSSETTTSDNVDTAGIWAGLELVTSGVNTGVTAEFNVGGRNGTNLILSSGDRVVVYAGNQSVQLEQDSDFLDIDYEGTIPIASDNAEFRVALERSSATSANNSTVRLPPNFEIFTPQAFSHFSEVALLDVTWGPSNPGSTVEIHASATCPNPQDNTQNLSFSEVVNTEDDGSYSSNILSQLTDADTDAGCDLSITIERVNSGDLDPAFTEGGYIRAIQRREEADITFRTN